MRTKYAFQGYEPELMARAIGKDLSISTKQAIEICNYLRYKDLQRAKTILNEAIAKKHPIPFKRFTNGVGHRKGNLGAGRFPVKACTAILQLVESAEINAQNKGLHTGELMLKHLCAHQASRPMHYGRKRGEMKRTHVEVVLQEKPKKGEKKEKGEKRIQGEKKPAKENIKPAKDNQKEVHKEVPKAVKTVAEKTKAEPEVKTEKPAPKRDQPKKIEPLPEPKEEVKQE